MARQVIPGIYRITNKVNGKVYIGESVNILKRFKQYYWESSNPNDSSYNRPINIAIREFGIENFEFSILLSGPQYATHSTRAAAEVEMIRRYNSTDPKFGYNDTDGGEIGAMIPRVQSIHERWARAKPAFLYDTKTQNVLLYFSGAKGVSSDFNCDKAITSHALNRGDIFMRRYYILPADYHERYHIVDKRKAKLQRVLDKPNTPPRSIHLAENNHTKFMDAVKYIDQIAPEFGYEVL